MEEAIIGKEPISLMAEFSSHVIKNPIKNVG